MSLSATTGAAVPAAGVVDHAARPDDVVAPPVSLRSLTVRGSMWTMVEYGASQAVRLASNLILQRLLFPEAFGLMWLVYLFIQALEMFSDIGIGPSIIQDKRGEDPKFLNTAWTMQVIRGVLLTVAAGVLAWPASQIYHAPELLWLLPIVGLSAFISGLNSTNLYLLNRRLALGRLALINLGTQVLGTVATVLLAVQIPNVIALVGGALIGTVIKLGASHVLCPGPRARFEWDRDAARNLFHFGKWIFLSTVFGFLATRGDQAILGWYMPTKAQFGIYATALFYAQGVVQALHTISSRVLFPVYARLAERDAASMRHQMFRVRAVLMAGALPPVIFLAIWGSDVVRLICDPKFYDAGWMLQILCVGAVASVIGSTIGPVLLAVSDSYRFMVIQAARTVILCASMAIGGAFFGLTGVIVGVAVPEYLLYPVLIACVRRYGVWMPWLDLAGFLGAGLLIAIGVLLWN